MEILSMQPPLDNALFTGREDPTGRDEQFEKMYLLLLEASPQAASVQAFEVGNPKDEVPLGEILDELVSRKYVSQVLVAVILCGLGEKDRALACLERAYEERCPQLVLLKVNPRLDALRAEPRFQSLMRRMGFM